MRYRISPISGRNTRTDPVDMLAPSSSSNELISGVRRRRARMSSIKS